MRINSTLVNYDYSIWMWVKAVRLLAWTYFSAQPASVLVALFLRQPLLEASNSAATSKTSDVFEAYETPKTSETTKASGIAKTAEITATSETAKTSELSEPTPQVQVSQSQEKTPRKSQKRAAEMLNLEEPTSSKATKGKAAKAAQKSQRLEATSRYALRRVVGHVPKR